MNECQYMRSLGMARWPRRPTSVAKDHHAELVPFTWDMDVAQAHILVGLSSSEELLSLAYVRFRSRRHLGAQRGRVERQIQSRIRLQP